jgi:hypothetical protein
MKWGTGQETGETAWSDYVVYTHQHVEFYWNSWEDFCITCHLGLEEKMNVGWKRIHTKKSSLEDQKET